MDNNLKVETRYDDLTGAISVNFVNHDFYSFAAEVARVDLERYQPIAMRVYVEKGAVLTIFALDKARFSAHKETTGKLLVRKYKVDISLEELFTLIRQLDFTLVSGEYKLEDMDVII